MSISPAFILARLRHRRKRRQPESTPTPPVTPDSILSVARESSTAVIATVSSPVVNVEPNMGMWVQQENFDAIPALAAELIDATHVRFTFPEDISLCTLWMVEDYAAWQMLDGGILVPPYSGEIL